MTTITKSKLKKTDDQINIEKCRETGNIISKFCFYYVVFKNLKKRILKKDNILTVLT